LRSKEFEDILKIVNRDLSRKTIDERDHLMVDIANLIEAISVSKKKEEQLFAYKHDVIDKLSVAIIEPEKAKSEAIKA
jgi:hypothetical protein